MSISTRRGDSGQTDLLFGCRLPKSHPRVHAIGAVDELNAALGPLRIASLTPEARDIVPQVQTWLIVLMGELATPPGQEPRYREQHQNLIDAAKVQWLDQWVAQLESAGALQFKGWALPGEGGVMSGAWADLARVTCRRAERHIIDLQDTPDHVPNADIARFLNRLADVLWLLARWEERAGNTGLADPAPRPSPDGSTA